MAKYKCEHTGSTIGAISKKRVHWTKDQEFTCREGDVDHVKGMKLIEAKKRRKKSKTKSSKK